MSGPIVHITGARPNFPKAAPVIKALNKRGFTQILVHTGQHYDDSMSEVFFRELDLPRPDVNLGVGSGSQAAQTAAIMTGLEPFIDEHKPALVVVYGDVNSTVAAALVAAKLGFPVAHVEAGLRSFDMSMPEEVNRKLTDQLSNLLLVTSADAVGHLAREGIAGDRVHLVGNPMIDTLLEHTDRLDTEEARERHGLGDRYAVVTLHRPSNVDAADKARQVVDVLSKMSERLEIILPLHPRGRRVLEEAGLLANSAINVVDPLPYTRFMALVKGATLVLTDSGGVQEEAAVLGVPCLTMRDNTERPVTITHGTNQLVRPDQVLEVVDVILTGRDPVMRIASRPPLWDGQAGERIAAVLTRWLAGRRGI